MIKNIRELLAKLPLPFFQNPAPVVAILPLQGVIGTAGRFSDALNLNSLEDNIKAAFETYNVKAVALAINSPGGSPVQSDLIVKAIRRLADETEVPVYAFAEDVAASGGYMLALAGDEIYAHEASIIGSIGVINAGFGFQGALEKLGVERRVYTSGESKSVLDPFKPAQEKDVKILEAMLKEIHEFFKNMVKDCRGDKLKGTQKLMFSGEFWTGREAKKLGLIDELGDLHGVMREKFGKKVKFKRIEKEKGFVKGLLGMSTKRARISDDIAATLESRGEWGRFGL